MPILLALVYFVGAVVVIAVVVTILKSWFGK